ncbi:hypothetical protein [Rubinisphaera italica]|uniref:Lipoprotein n=1 Tax=Rubinisphaera italica TaxID=2527969 RepID=A0A5C5XN91_9PLAN|nr:hypothetical protein [Rubinisphaera italica]TWT64178.1 hypothetical protein Pan54_49390 [Rubinisphaera italica]HBN78667.1 hypothetical protein [Planctomycetaceae bacterium]
MSRNKLFSSLMYIISAASLVGCSMMPHALQPKQLRKLNRGPELGRDSYNFSIPDPQPEKHQADGMMYGDPFNN